MKPFFKNLQFACYAKHETIFKKLATRMLCYGVTNLLIFCIIIGEMPSFWISLILILSFFFFHAGWWRSGLCPYPHSVQHDASVQAQ